MAQPLSRGEGKAGGRPRAGGPDLLRPLRTARSTSSRPFPPCTPFLGGSPSPRLDPALQPPSRFSSGRYAPTSSPGPNRGSCRPRRGARCDRRLRHSGAWSRVGRGRARRLAAPGSLVLRIPGLRPAVRTPLSILRRLARACGHCTLTSTLPRRLWPKEFWVPDVPRGPRLHPSGRRGSLCQAEGAGWPGLGPLPRGRLSPCLNQTPRERREQVPPGETKLLVPTPETPTPAAPAGQPASSSEPLRSGLAPPPSSSGRCLVWPSTRGTELPVPGPATQRPPASAPGSVWCRLAPVPRLPCTPFYLNFPCGVRVTPERPLAALPRRPRPPRRVWCWDLPSRKTKTWRKVEKQGSHIEALQRN